MDSESNYSSENSIEVENLKIPETYSVIEERNHLRLSDKNMPLPLYDDVCPPNYRESVYYPQIKIKILPDTDYDLTDYTIKEEEIKAEKKKREIDALNKEKETEGQIKRFNTQKKFFDDLSKGLFKYNKMLSDYKKTVKDALENETDPIKRDMILDDIYFKSGTSTIDRLEDWKAQTLIYLEPQAENLKKKLCLNYTLMSELISKWIQTKMK